MAAIERTEPPTERLVARSLEAEDGAIEFWTWVDTRLNAACAGMPAADAQLRCLPRTAVVASMAYADDRCATPAGTVRQSSGCAKADFVRVENNSVCPTRHLIHRAGPRLASAYQDFGEDGCLPSTDVNYQMASYLPPDEFARITRTVWRPAGAALALELEGPPGRASRPRLRDPNLDEACQPSTCQGDTRCIPAAPQVVGRTYADPECREPLVGRARGTCRPRLAQLEPNLLLRWPWRRPAPRPSTSSSGPPMPAPSM